MVPTKSFRRLCVVAACLPLALAACGSSHPTHSSSGATATATKGTHGSEGGTSSGQKVTVEMLSQITAADFGSPETVPMAKAVAAQINAHGGLGGHPINLVTCNDKQDPTTAGNCARTAAQDHAVAVVGGITLEGTTTDPILQAAHIPLLVSPAVPGDYANPTVYPEDGGTLAVWTGVGMLAARSGCKRVGSTYDSSNPVGATTPGMVKAGLATVGGASVVANVGVSESSVNLAPVIQSLLAKNVDCISLPLTPALDVAGIKAIAQSSKPSIPVVTDQLPAEILRQLGPAADHVLQDTYDDNPGSPGAAAFTSLARSAGASDTSFAENVYIGFLILQQALKGHTGPLSAADVTKALDSASGLTVSSAPGSFDYAKPFPAKAYARLSNLSVVGSSFNGKKLVQLPGNRGVIDTSSAAASFAKGG